MGSTLESANWHSWSADWHMASANRHFHSADWHNSKARPRNVQIKPKHIKFDFLGINIRPNLYLNRLSLFSKHKTSINRELKLEIRTLLSPYVKKLLDVLF